MKKIISDSVEIECRLKLHYVPSAENLADDPSRNISYTDCMLQETIWQVVDGMYGPHTVDLMATDANVMMSTSGLPLRHFTQYPSPQTAGVNVFAQDVAIEKSPYVFRRFTSFFLSCAFLKNKKLNDVPSLYPLFTLDRYGGHF